MDEYNKYFHFHSDKFLLYPKDLLSAVDKINSSLNQKTNGRNYFHQDEISSLGLGMYMP